jgi:hypothetical protein
MGGGFRVKIMQIFQRFCHWDATASVGDIDTARQRFPGLLFVEAPDYVFEGWGFDPSAEGDARFIKPTPREGWLYDEKTGTMYRAEDLKPSESKTAAQLTAENAALQETVTDLELALCDMYETLLSVTGG